jgi:hypothetical protein
MNIDIDYKLNNGQIVNIRKCKEDDAEQLIHYLKTIGSETDYLTFGSEGVTNDVEGEKQFIRNSQKRDNSIMIVCTDSNSQIIAGITFTGGLKDRIKCVFR